MSLVINPIIENVLQTVCASVDWLQNNDAEPPEQFVVWAEEDLKPLLTGNNRPVVMASWVQVSLYTRKTTAAELDPVAKANEIVSALELGGFSIIEYPTTRIEANGYYHTVIHARYVA